jgi:DNA processing protein
VSAPTQPWPDLGLTIVQIGQPAYPRRLEDLADSPEQLFVRGQLRPVERSVAIVGSRAASGNGVATAARLARELAAAGLAVVSGGAIGIDAAAHRGALEAGGITIAVLGCGLDIAYPARNRRLFAAICASGGALVSPYAMGVPPRGYHFVRRNRIIAGLADVVVVVEAGLASGALHTAMAARQYGRVLCATPHTPGCEQLIAEGAAIARSGGGGGGGP